MTNSNHIPSSRGVLILLSMLALLLTSLTAFVTTTTASDRQPNNLAAAPAWMEPRGLSIIDAIGQVPESHLEDLILLFSGQHGILQYESGSRSGNIVTMRVRQEVINPNVIICPSMAGRLDEWVINLPPATMRIFSSGFDVTNQLQSTFTYTPSSQQQPDRGATNNRRYSGNRTATTQFDSSGAAIVPANMECEFRIGGAPLSNSVVEYKFDAPQRVKITVVGQESKELFSWIGRNVQGAGILNNLNAQLEARFNNELLPWGRTDGIPTDQSVVGDADYFLPKYPPMPVNAYIDENVTRFVKIPGGGSVRVRASSDLNFAVSTDNTAAALRPMFGTWKDADLTPGSDFLTHFNDFDVTMMPEYILPPGVDYRPCMTNGGCSGQILDEVYDARYTMQLFYYKVERIDGTLDQIPLKLVGKGWQARDAAALTASRLYLPLLTSPKTPLPDNPRADCPCGWFDEFGRMFDFTLPP